MQGGWGKVALYGDIALADFTRQQIFDPQPDALDLHGAQRNFTLSRMIAETLQQQGNTLYLSQRTFQRGRDLADITFNQQMLLSLKPVLDCRQRPIDLMHHAGGDIPQRLQPGRLIKLHAAVGLALEKIKIDRSLISGAGENRKGQVIARNIARMGLELKLEVLAEGIETAEQWSLMQDFGCTAF